jgi:hypothetical protein
MSITPYTLPSISEEPSAAPSVERRRLSVAQILAWADDHRRRTGTWPITTSGRVLAAPGESWLALDRALRRGSRGLPEGEGLAGLLQRERGVRNKQDLPSLTEEQIVAWALAHHRRTGSWPHRNDGTVDGAPGEKWVNVHNALVGGHRGLPGGDSLARLLARRLGNLSVSSERWGREEPAREQSCNHAVSA